MTIGALAGRSSTTSSISIARSRRSSAARPQHRCRHRLRFPRTYRKFGEPVSIDGVRQRRTCRDRRRGRRSRKPSHAKRESPRSAPIRGEGGEVRAVWFHQPFIQERLKPGRRVFLSGVFKKKGGVWETPPAEVVASGRRRDESLRRHRAIYRLTEGESQTNSGRRSGRRSIASPTALKIFCPSRSDVERRARPADRSPTDSFAEERPGTGSGARAVRLSGTADAATRVRYAQAERLYKRIAPLMPLTEEIDRRISSPAVRTDGRTTEGHAGGGERPGPHSSR